MAQTIRDRNPSQAEANVRQEIVTQLPMVQSNKRLAPQARSRNVSPLAHKEIGKGLEVHKQIQEIRRRNIRPMKPATLVDPDSEATYPITDP